MASWIVHLQIAEKLLDLVNEENQIQFIVGNIGPDCGKIVENSDDFEPSSKITHWKISEDKSKLDAEGFFATYLLHPDKDKKAFYLGYYVHLITDMMWSNQIYEPVIRKKTEDEIKKDFQRKIKRDWYDLDHLYLRNHPEFKGFQLFSQIKQFDNIYLDYYSKNAFTDQIKLISDFYLGEHSGLDHEYIYLTESRREDFIEEVSAFIRRDLKEKMVETR